MQYDLKGTARLFNRILGEERINTISKINIEYNPKGLADGTSFDAYIEYTPMGANPGAKGGIGIEVKYTEKNILSNMARRNGKKHITLPVFILLTIIVPQVTLAVGSYRNL